MPGATSHRAALAPAGVNGSATSFPARTLPGSYIGPIMACHIQAASAAMATNRIAPPIQSILCMKAPFDYDYDSATSGRQISVRSSSAGTVCGESR